MKNGLKMLVLIALALVMGISCFPDKLTLPPYRKDDLDDIPKKGMELQILMLMADRMMTV